MASSSNSSMGENIDMNISFVRDIQLMMYGLGDCSQPLQESAELVEDTVLKQMVSIVNQAKAVTAMRCEEVIGPEDILFLMRSNLEALKRLIEYLGIKDDKQIVTKVLSEEECIETEASLSGSAQEENSPPSWRKSRKHYCLEFLKTIGIDDMDIEEADDAVKIERQMRANQTSLYLSPMGYKNFHAARATSFGAAQLTPKRFLNWLKIRGGITYEIKPPVAEVLVYLAKETIATIIDMVLTLREESLSQRVREPQPITVEEIREVIRRCCLPQTISFSVFTRDIPQIIETRLLAI